jgi:uncharacterized protein YggE
MLKQVACGALATLITCAVPALAADQPVRRLVVSGTGDASVRPDVAVIAAGVVARADTAAAALAENSAAMNRVLEQLRTAGVADELVQTSQFSVRPLYETPERGVPTPETPRIIGYQVANQVTVRVADLDRLGRILDALVTAGSNSIEGPSFDLADPDALLDQARDAAVADALAKARRYAAAAGVELGEILTIEEGGAYAPPPRPMMRAEAMAADVPIAPGQTEVTANVTITFAID